MRTVKRLILLVLVGFSDPLFVVVGGAAVVAAVLSSLFTNASSSLVAVASAAFSKPSTPVYTTS